MTLFFLSSRRRHTRCLSDWSSDVCSSDLVTQTARLTRPSPSVSKSAQASPVLLPDHPVSSKLQVSLAPPAQVPLKIGRASCRERGEIGVRAEERGGERGSDGCAGRARR